MRTAQSTRLWRGSKKCVLKPLMTELPVPMKYKVHCALNRWLQDVISVEDVHVVIEEIKLRVIIEYVVFCDDECRLEVIEQNL